MSVIEQRIRAYDRQGLMGDITTLLDSENINIRDVRLNYSRALVNVFLVIDVKDIDQLSRVLTRLENVPNVLSAVRERGG